MLLMGTFSWMARATVAGAIIGPGHAAKMMQLKNKNAKAASRFHVGQSWNLLVVAGRTMKVVSYERIVRIIRGLRDEDNVMLLLQVSMNIFSRQYYRIDLSFPVFEVRMLINVLSTRLLSVDEKVCPWRLRFRLWFENTKRHFALLD